jgi:glycosyltransferase involved in cell wall biosynthesis
MQDIPFVSVLMPVRNEAYYIRRALRAVLQQDYPAASMEVLVIDGLSTDGTRSILRSIKKTDPRIRIIDNPKMIVPTGLNIGIREARGEVIVRVDGHCELDRHYVSRCVSHLREDNIDVVGGPLETIGETPVARIIALAMSSRFAVGGSAFRTVTDRSMLTDTVAFPASWSSLIRRAGHLDEELVRNQDDEYNYRLRGMGAKILLAPDVRCRYYSRGSLASLWRQYFQYGFWKVRVLQKHPFQMQARQFVPGLFVLSLAVSLATSLLWHPAIWVFAAIVSAYLAANLIESLTKSATLSWRTVALLSLSIAAIHLAYGLGFLTGLIKFSNRWRTTGSPVPMF